MGDDDRADRLRARAERIDRRGEVLPVAGVAGVDEREFRLLGDEVEVDSLRPEPVDALRDLGLPLARRGSHRSSCKLANAVTR
jgi:hypothetical protein